MARKKKDDQSSSQSDQKTKEKKTKRERRKLVWDPSDGVTWEDFAGVIIAVLKFIIKVIAIILWPVQWAYKENARMWRFIRVRGTDRVLTMDEKYFVESIPVILTLTGLIGGILVGLLGILSIQDVIDQFLQNFSLNGIFEVIKNILIFFFDVIVWILTGFYNLFIAIGRLIGHAWRANPFVAFLFIVGIGLLTLIVYLILSEKGLLSKVWDGITKTLFWILGSPDLLRGKMINVYRKFNHWFTTKLLGDEVLHTRTQMYFKRAIGITAIATLWSFAAGIFVGIDPTRTTGYVQWQKVLFIATVLLVAGLISGTIFLMFIGRFLDFLNRKKYIAPEFLKSDGSINKDMVKTRTKEANKEIADDKPWKRKPEPVKEEPPIEEETKTET